MFRLKPRQNRVINAKGDPNNEQWVLGMSNLQFGKYRGKNFLWLLQKDVGWATMLMADHGKAREKTTKDNDSQWQNKEALYRYYACKSCEIHYL